MIRQRDGGQVHQKDGGQVHQKDGGQVGQTISIINSPPPIFVAGDELGLRI